MKSSIDGVRPPQQARSQRTLEQILDAGTEIFAEQGYEGFSIAEVCRRSGSSAGALYARFENKQALIRAIHDHALTDLSTEITAAYAVSPSWRMLPTDEFIERAVRLLIQHFHDHAAIVRAIVLRAAVDPLMRAGGTAYVAQMADAFTSLLLERAADFPKDNPEEAIRSTFATVFEATSWDIAFGSEFRATGSLGNDDRGDRLVRVSRLLLTEP